MAPKTIGTCLNYRVRLDGWGGGVLGGELLIKIALPLEGDTSLGEFDNMKEKCTQYNCEACLQQL